MAFEYDPAKSAANKDKHGINFEEAQGLWNDPHMIEAPARTANEQRFLAVGRIEGRHWAAVYTLRGSDVRLISVRRARPEEIDRYEGR